MNITDLYNGMRYVLAQFGADLVGKFNETPDDTERFLTELNNSGNYIRFVRFIKPGVKEVGERRNGTWITRREEGLK